jgi:hypothetical protein
MGAGLLPICIYKNKIYFLFGKENYTNDTPGWSDFGGGREKNETDIDTASREGAEELNGFFGDTEDIKKLILSNKTVTIDTNGYKTYITKIECDFKLPVYYKKNYKFLERKLPKVIEQHNGLLEKDEIKWFSFNEIKKNINKFRSFYKNVANNILKQKRMIIRKYIIKTRKYKKHKKGRKTNKTIKENN